jgi:hypothetical protein
MRLKLAENMPTLLATSLRGAGHDVHTQTVIVSLAERALQLAREIDMTNRVAIVEDERVRIRPPLAIIPSQEPT